MARPTMHSTIVTADRIMADLVAMAIRRPARAYKGGTYKEIFRVVGITGHGGGRMAMHYLIQRGMLERVPGDESRYRVARHVLRNRLEAELCEGRS